MISDTLSQVTGVLDRYLTDPIFDAVYTGEIRERLIRLRDEADNLRSALDAPPVPEPDDRPHQTGSTPGGWIDRMMDPATAHEIATPYFSRSDLLRREWTMGLIDQLLGRHDWTATNPHGAGFSPMQCWRQDRVLMAEETAAFRERS
jgi:hypothetical protein